MAIQVSQFDWQLATRTLYQEARGEPYIGQKAVACVLLNRLSSERWGKNLASVCLWWRQFSGWNSTDPNFAEACALDDQSQQYYQLKSIIMAAITEPDITSGATHYYAVSMKVPPEWSLGATPCGQFGNQLFFKGVK